LTIQKGGHELRRERQGKIFYPLIRVAEARQIKSIDPAALGGGLDIISPILTGGSQAVDQKEWTPLAQDPIAGVDLPHLYISIFRVLHHKTPQKRRCPSPAVSLPQIS